MIVLVAGAHGRLGSRVVALLLRRGHLVRALVRTHAQAAVLRDAGAETVVADLRGDVEWTAEGCNAAVFTAAARSLPRLRTIGRIPRTRSPNVPRWAAGRPGRI